MNKRIIALLLSFLMIFTMMPTNAHAAVFSDMPNDWSTAALENAVSNGLLTGYGGKLEPNSNLTRAEMATIVNRAFGAYEQAALDSYTDVSTDSWFYDEMAKAVFMKTFTGSENKLSPNNNITREEAFVVLSRAFKLSGDNNNVLNKFSDYDLISKWAIEGISSLVNKGYIAGSDGKLNPKGYITKAEFAQVMDNLLKNFIKIPGTFTGDLTGNVMINAAGVTLKNLTVNGDLIIGDGVGDGDITLNGITVTGRILIRGGGENSIKITGKSAVKNIIVARVNGQVRVFAEDGTEVGEIVVDGYDNVIIEGKVESVKVLASDVTLIASNANISSASMEGENVKLTATNTSILRAVIINSKNAQLEVSADCSVEKVTANGKGAAVNGEGKIANVQANADNVVVNTQNTRVVVAENAEGVKVDGKEVKGGTTITTSSTQQKTSRRGGKSSNTTTPSAIEAYGNEFEIGTYREFETGVEFNNVTLSEDIGDGAVILKAENGKYPSQGEYISQIIEVPYFKYMIASWNSDAPEGTYVEIQARVLVNHFDENGEEIQTWTDWLSWGEWGPFIERFSYSSEDTLAKISVDELTIKGSNGETASKVQLKAILYTEDPSVTPTVRYLHGTLKNTLPGQSIEKEFKDEINITDLNKVIPTPNISQMKRDPRIASSICSPTTITMMMNRMGEDLLPEEVAQNNYDFNYGFGNWAFTMASAGSYGYKSYVDYTTVDGLKREIAKGYPVGVSVKYTNDPGNKKYPYLEGAPGTTGGHLFLVTGFKTIDGAEYVIANDPFAGTNETVERVYKLEQFDKAWSNRTAYIVHDKEENAGFAHTKRVEAKLIKTERPYEYEVYYNGTNINVQNFGGNIIYTADNGETYSYFAKQNKNSLKFDDDVITNPDLKVYIITDVGYVYVATAEELIEGLAEAVEEEYIESIETEEVNEEPEKLEEPDEPGETEESGSDMLIKQATEN